MNGRLEIPTNLSLSQGQRWVEERFGTVLAADEAGRGPLAGPVVAAVVILPQHHFDWGVDDSKQLSEAKREELFPQIQERAIAWAIGEASAAEIDQHNILGATFLAVRRAVEQVALPWDLLLMDGSLLVRGIVPEKQRCLVKGDARVESIAAASILAKVHRDRLMRRYGLEFPQYGFEKHKGYPSQQHIDAIRQHGWTSLHRRSFRVKALEQEPELQF